MNFSKEQEYDTSVRLSIDGKSMGAIRNQPKSLKPMKFLGARVSETAVRPFFFSTLKVTG
jgi:hypothetical protein